jgi:ABC-type cobalamin/Fe3+-siderophores transport system ATPase subunit/SAM-dependent methyltransferase
MKISAVNFSEEITTPFGLKKIRMDRLQSVVILAGKNGAGKSRFLKLLKEQVVGYPTKDAMDGYKSSIAEAEKAIQIIEGKMTTVKAELERLGTAIPRQKQIQETLKSYKNELERHQNNIKGWQGFQVRAERLSLVPHKEENAIIDFVPKATYLNDSYSMSARDLDESANQIFILGTSSTSFSVIPAITRIQRRATNVRAGGEDLSISSKEKEDIEKAYERLIEYIKIFLGTDLKRDKDGNPVLFGKRIGEAQLSEGQSVLLQFCLALYAQEGQLDRIVVILDEPENHLHPAALIEVLDKITAHVKNGQVWIATHSINIIAHYDPSCIWYIDEGEVSYAGNVPQKVLTGLLGPDEEIARLGNLLSLPAQMASTQYAFESLFEPKPVMTGSADPQVEQIHKAISALKSSGQKLRVLDFGMGKGRLLGTIFENERLRESDVSEWLDFYGFDTDASNKLECEKIFTDVYGSSANRYFNEEKKLLSAFDAESFDIIVMCNVFHEIDPNSWISIFKGTLSVCDLLKKTGHLLVVEDQLLAVGEKAHSRGFLVFDSLEFKKLFKIKESDGYTVDDHKGDGRLKAHRIPQQVLGNIDPGSRVAAIEALRASAKAEIRRIRNEPPSYKNGKLHAFWAQQLANADLSLEELT